MKDATRHSKQRDAAGYKNINPRDADIEHIDDLTQLVHALELEVGTLQRYDSTNQKSAFLHYFNRIEDCHSTEQSTPTTVFEDVTNT